uniref:Uncharacterized protein n=1 Tax=Parascaris equorum TaxID=6256 RepID=A0A914R6N8_PAREQ
MFEPEVTGSTAVVLSSQRDVVPFSIDERDDDDGEEFHRYSLSMDDDVSMSPNTAKFMYQAQNTSRLSDFVMEEQLENDVVYDEHGSQFELEVDRLVP